MVKKLNHISVENMEKERMVIPGMKKCNFGKLAERCDTHPRGSSSYNMHDSEQLFEEFNLKTGDVVLDLGCGPGDYTLACANLVGETGRIYALEKQPELLDDLNERAAQMELGNVTTMVCDITACLPVASQSIDVCLLITVLHHPEVSPRRKELFDEIKRVLRPDGRLITVDVKKEDESFGPPMHMRLAPEELERIAREHHFAKVRMTDLGFNYMLQFKRPL